MGYSVIVPNVVTLATMFANVSVNQRLPSGPAAMSQAPLLAVGMGYSVNKPPVVTLATLFAPDSMNQSFPSGPATMPAGLLKAAGIGYSVTAPEVVILATLLGRLFELTSVNQRLPSGPAAMPRGVPPVGVGYSVMSPTAATTLPIEKISPVTKITNPATARAGDVDIPHRSVLIPYLPTHALCRMATHRLV